MLDHQSSLDSFLTRYQKISAGSDNVSIICLTSDSQPKLFDAVNLAQAKGVRFFASEHLSHKTYTRQLSEFLSGGGAVGILLSGRDLTNQEFYSDLKNLKDYGYLNARGDINPKIIDSLFLFILTDESYLGQFELERLTDYRLMI